MDELYTVDLESECPDGRRAVNYLSFTIASVRARGGRIIKVRHGNAGSVSGGKLKAPARAAVRRMKKEGRVNFYILGEELCVTDEETRYLIEKFPFVRQQDKEFGTRTDTYIMLCI